MRKRGEGSVYKRSKSRFWQISYSRRGKVYRESTECEIDCGSAKRNATAHRNAERKLQQRLREIATNTFVPPSLTKVTVADLIDSLQRDYRINKRKSAVSLGFRLKHLIPVFGDMLASEVTSQHVTRYVDQRQREDAANATINRELAALKRMFYLGYKQTPRMVSNIPSFPAKLDEGDARSGFVSDAQREMLAQECSLSEGLWMRCFLELATTFGWRKGELLGLRVKQVDVAGSINLGTSKNGTPRNVHFDPKSPLAELLAACISGKQSDGYVFTRDNGKRVKDFRRAWWKACIAVGLGKMICKHCETTKCEHDKTKYVGLLVHDLRRSAARDLRRAGVAEHVVMQMGGWKTRSVMDRYSIVAEDDMLDAVQKLQRRRELAHFSHTSTETGATEDVKPSVN